MPALQLSPKMSGLIQKRKRYKVFFGGRGGAKSTGIADTSTYLVSKKGLKFGCFRELQNSIEESVHSLLKSRIKHLQVPGFTITDKKIDHANGGAYRFRGLARNPVAVQSMNEFDVFWGEEAQAFSQDSIEVLTPTLREGGSELWLSLNPRSSEDPISQRFLIPYYEKLLKDGIYEDDSHLIVWVNMDDNPWAPQALIEERAIAKEMMPRSKYLHIWEGHFSDDVENAIIAPDWFDAAVDAHIKLGFQPRGHVRVTFDPADVDGDNKAVVLRHGQCILDAIEVPPALNVNESMDMATDWAIQNNCDSFVWDGIGIGLGLQKQADRKSVV